MIIRNRPRSEKGMSLVVVLGISVIATMFVSAMFGILMPSYQRVAVIRNTTELRNAAEAGIDWAVYSYNLDQGAAAGINNSTYGQGAGPWVNVPTSMVNPNGNNSYSPIVQVQTNNIQPPNTSYLYESSRAYFPGGPQYYYSPYAAGNPPPPNNFSTIGNGWRVISVRAVPPNTQLNSVTVQQNGLNVTLAQQQAVGVVKNLQIILQPNPPQSINLNAAIMSNSVSFKGANYTADMYNSTVSVNPASFGVGGNIDSNGIVALGNSVINGNVTSRNQPMGNTTTSYVTGDRNAGVKGTVVSNGLIDSAIKSNTSGQLPGGGTSPTPVLESQSLSQNAAATLSVPGHPIGSSLISPITGNVSLGKPGLRTYSNYYINAGGSEISLSGQSAISVNGPTAIYLEGNTSSSTTVMTISGQGSINNVSKKPADLIIYYGGTGTLDLHGLGTFYGVIVAPHATTILGGNAQVYGAIISNVVGLNGGGNSGAVHYDQALSGLNLGFSVPTYEAVSWREF